jgi:hypothetical protein
LPTDNDFTKILSWPGYRVYRHEINEKNKTLKLWMRRKRGNRVLLCSSCGRRVEDIQVYKREVRDLPCFEFQTTVIIELYRIGCPNCGVKAEKVEPLPSKAPYSKRFEDAVGHACESAVARQVARRMGLAESTVRTIDLRYLERWEAKRRKPPLRQMGVDELYKGKRDKFLTVVCNLETGEPLWFGKERKKETLDDFFGSQLVSRQRKRMRRRVWTCGTPSGKASSNGPRSARSSTTSFTCCNTPTRLSMRCARQSFSAGAQEAGAHQRDEVVTAESMEEPDLHPPRRIEPAVWIKPAGL